MDRDAKIAMARSVAPEAISRDAEIVVFGRHGYETAVKGKNGFVCDVERSWMGPFDKNPELWNPKVRGAECYNPQPARLALPGSLVIVGSWDGPETLMPFTVSVGQWPDRTAAPVI
jgi:hypothetical protein